MLVTKTAKTVTNISKLSPTHFVSNIRPQHRCSPSVGNRLEVEALKDYSVNDFASIFKFGDSVPEIYMENITQKLSSFIHLPMEFVLSKCRLISESDSVFLVKTARNAYEDRFRLRYQCQCLQIIDVVYGVVLCVV